MIAIAYCMRLDGKLKALRTGNDAHAGSRARAAAVRHARRERRDGAAPLRRRRRAASCRTKIDEARAMAAHPLVLVRDFFGSRHWPGFRLRSAADRTRLVTMSVNRSTSRCAAAACSREMRS